PGDAIQAKRAFVPPISPTSRGKVFATVPAPLRASVAAHAVDEVCPPGVAFLLHEAMHVGVEARERGVELAREAQEIDDLAVEALTRDEQRDAGRVRRQQRCRDAS